MYFSSLLDLAHQGGHGESSALAAASAAGKILAVLANGTSAAKRRTVVPEVLMS